MNDASVRIPLGRVDATYCAYVKFSRAPEDVKQAALEWASVQAEPVRATVTGAIESPGTQLRVVPKEEAPTPPRALLAATGMGPDEERRFRQATHLVLVTAEATRANLPEATLGTLAIAQALAAKFDGVCFDPIEPRLIPVRRQYVVPPSNGALVIANHIVCPASDGPSGAWHTTTGLKRFGFCNLEMRHVPQGLSQGITAVLMTVAQRLVTEAASQARAGSDGEADAVVLPAEIEITAEDLVAAFGKGTPPAGRTTVRVTFDGSGRDGMDPLIEIGPPMSFSGDVGRWYHEMLGDLLKLDASEVVSPAADRKAALEEATARAQREWPDLRARFEAGLPPGQMLAVKRRFSHARGAEFMWVALVGLQGGDVLGTLMNESTDDANLKRGANVRFPETDIFDWGLVGDGGFVEGGYTDAVLTASSGSAQGRAGSRAPRWMVWARRGLWLALAIKLVTCVFGSHPHPHTEADGHATAAPASSMNPWQIGGVLGVSTIIIVFVRRSARKRSAAG
jgi:uncharacterized protein YegJ (DUF2314 family)